MGKGKAIPESTATARKSQLIAAGAFHYDDFAMRAVMHDDVGPLRGPRVAWARRSRRFRSLAVAPPPVMEQMATSSNLVGKSALARCVGQKSSRSPRASEMPNHWRLKEPPMTITDGEAVGASRAPSQTEPRRGSTSWKERKNNTHNASTFVLQPGTLKNI